MLLSVGVTLSPFPHLGFAKRDLSGFSAIADSGEYVAWGFGCLVIGSVAFVASFLIRGDVQE